MIMGKNIINQLQIIIYLLSLFLISCNQSQPADNFTYTVPSVDAPPPKSLPRVVVTTGILCSLTQQIAGETINLDCLIPADKNPRSYQITPTDQQAINQAQLIMVHGYNLEPSLIAFMRTQKQLSPVVAVGEQAQPKPRLLKSGNKSVADPFIWHDVRNGIKMADIIRNQLQNLVPENAHIYRQNHQKLVTELNQLHNWIQSRIASIPAYNRIFISIHPELGYYANTYGLASRSYLQPISNKSQISTEQINTLAQAIRKTRVPAIFVEAGINPLVFQAIAQQSQVRIFTRPLFTYGLGKHGSQVDTYQRVMTHNTRAIVEGLGGTYLMFEVQANR